MVTTGRMDMQMVVLATPRSQSRGALFLDACYTQRRRLVQDVEPGNVDRNPFHSSGPKDRMTKTSVMAVRLSEPFASAFGRRIWPVHSTGHSASAPSRP
jgi:hypothetical protein